MHDEHSMPAGAGVGTPAPEADTAAALEAKTESTTIALLAIHGGHVVHKLQGGEYLVVWRSQHRHCANLAELQTHARRLGAVR